MLGRTPYSEQNFLHANSKGLEGNYYWPSFWNWTGARIIFHTGSNQQTFKNSLHFNQRGEKGEETMGQGYFCASTVFALLFLYSNHKAKIHCVTFWHSKIWSSITAFFFFFLYFSFYTSSHHHFMLLVLSFPQRQKVFYSASFCRYFTIL